MVALSKFSDEASALALVTEQVGALAVVVGVLPALRQRDPVVEAGAHRVGVGKCRVDRGVADCAGPFVAFEHFEAVDSLGPRRELPRETSVIGLSATRRPRV